MPFFATPRSEGGSFDGFLNLLQQDSIQPFRADIIGPAHNFHWRSDLVAAPSVAFLRAHYTQDWTLIPETSDEGLSVIMPVQGGGFAARVDGTDQRVGTDMALLTPNCRLEKIMMCSDPALHSATLMFSADAVRRTLSNLAGDLPLSRLELSPVLDFNTSAGAWFRQIAQALAAGMHDERLLERSPLAFELLVEAALQVILTQVPSRLNTGLRKSAPITAPRHVGRAIDYMRAHLHEPITSGDIARSAGVSVRGLQWAFQRYYGISPVSYLRRLRLEAVHLELSNPGNILPVSEVALKWGFVHMGRFSGQYKKAFGILPSETARQASSSR